MEEKVAGWTGQKAPLLGRSGQKRWVLSVGRLSLTWLLWPPWPVQP